MAHFSGQTPLQRAISSPSEQPKAGSLKTGCVPVSIPFGLFSLCVLIQIVASLLIDEPLKPEARELVWNNWSEPLRMKCGSGLADYRIMSAIVFAAFVSLYILFR